jgi:DNA-binding HxlR family transcriptional regulator
LIFASSDEYARPVKSYQQYCSVARALDVVGDRWILLIVRELLAWGPSRYSDLKRGLPSIASNLLADRLKVMEAEGLIERHDAPPPVGATLYQLTERGRELQDVMRALAEWGLPRMTSGPNAEDAVQPHWTALIGGLTLPGVLQPGAEIVLGVESEGETMRVVLRPDGFELRRGALPAADVTIAGSAQLVGAVLSGLLTPTESARMGLRITGRRKVLIDLVDARVRADHDKEQR